MVTVLGAVHKLCHHKFDKFLEHIDLGVLNFEFFMFSVVRMS